MLSAVFLALTPKAWWSLLPSFLLVTVTHADQESIMLGSRDSSEYVDNYIPEDTAKANAAAYPASIASWKDSLPSIEQIEKWVNAYAMQVEGLRQALPRVTRLKADSLYVEHYRYTVYRFLPSLTNSLLHHNYNENNGDTLKLSPREIGILRELGKLDIALSFFGIGSRGAYFKTPHFIQMFGPYVSHDLRALIELKEWENPDSYDPGCGPAHSFAEMGVRVVAWEHFIAKFPESKYVPVARKWYSTYLSDFLQSHENAPLKLGTKDKDDLLPMYQAFVKNHGNKKSGKIVKRFLKIKAKHGYGEVENLVGILDISPPGRSRDFE
jgi:hypothetical protein